MTVEAALAPVLPCTSLKDFFCRVLALLRDRCVLRQNSERLTSFGSNPSAMRSHPISSRARSMASCRLLRLPSASMFLLTPAYWQATSLGVGSGVLAELGPAGIG